MRLTAVLVLVSLSAAGYAGSENCPAGYTHLIGSGGFNTLSYLEDQTQSECVSKCNSDDGCKSFDYEANGLQCILYNYPNPDLDQQSGWVFCSKNGADNCRIGNGASYTGTQSTDENGAPCIAWNTAWQNNNPDGNLGHGAVCRNPDMEPKPWCWLTESQDESYGGIWSFCNIPVCTGPLMIGGITASMKSVYPGSSAAFAVDGDMDTVAKSVCTVGEGDAWLELDLNGRFIVNTVKIMHERASWRAEYYPTRFEVVLTDTTTGARNVCGYMKIDGRADQTYDIDCGGVVGDKLRLTTSTEEEDANYMDYYYYNFYYSVKSKFCIQVKEVQVIGESENCPAGYTHLIGTTRQQELSIFRDQTQSECGSKCNSDDGCKSFDYTSKWSVCYLYNFPNPDIDQESGLVFCSKNVDGQYGEWTVWSECTAECGAGTSGRVRVCDSPAAANGGADCEGESFEEKACNEQPCPVDGQLGEWTSWSACSRTCETGDQVRSRACDSPAMAHGGLDCEGEKQETQVCNEHRCPTAVMKAVYVNALKAVITCHDPVTDVMLDSILTNYHTNDDGSQSDVATLTSSPMFKPEAELNCLNDTWVCDVLDSDNYHGTTGEVPVMQFYDDEFGTFHLLTTKTINKGGYTFLDSWAPKDSTLNVHWVKDGQLSGYRSLGHETMLVVEEEGRYTARLSRCPNHSPVTRTWNIIMKDESLIDTSLKRCSVFGDPHVITFDGAFYDYHGACTYVLAMDCEGFTWFVYGNFQTCGEGATCLVTLDLIKIDSAGYYAIEIKRGLGINDNGIMKGVKVGEELDLGGMLLTFDGIYMHVDMGGASLKWDGLSFVKITTSKETVTCGLCSDNDGDLANDFDNRRPGKNDPLMNFADTWIINIQHKGRCGMVPLNSVETPTELMIEVFEEFDATVWGPAGLPLVGLEENSLSVAHDRMTFNEESPFLSSKFMECECYRAYFERLRDEYGYATDRWDVDLGCPNPRGKRAEGVRLGCPWTAKNIPFYLK